MLIAEANKGGVNFGTVDAVMGRQRQVRFFHSGFP